MKIGNKTFEFESPSDFDNTTTSIMNDWSKLVKQQKSNKDIWTTIPDFPQYKFKNLQIENNPLEIKDENIEVSLTFKYDGLEPDFIEALN